ncbi:MAG TPA: peptidylprolyl isomerase [Humibacter sp.]|nr:peptidylprolyl isomerase [Humibacter sp.]
MRRVPALLITAGLLVAALSGCSSNADASCVVDPGNASKLVTASGSFGSQQTVHFPTPLDTTQLQRSILRQGTGAPLEQGQLVETELTYFDGKTGKKFESASAMIPVSKTPYPGLGSALRCVPVGSRVSIVGSAKSIFGADRAQQAGFDPNQPLVFVVDAERASLARANGSVRPGQPGFPTVVLAPNGQPGLTIPNNDAPKTVRSEVLKQGHGATVTKHDKLVVNFTAVDWSGKTVTASSWQDGAPVVWDLAADASSGGAPAGLTKQLVGSHVGSQLVVIVPATGSTGTATAYVVDVLGIL